MLIHRLRLKNVLSFGPDGIEVELGNLNVIIGPNASGKSNLIEAISLLHATPRDLTEPIRDGGGVRDWLWQGTTAAIGTVEALLDNGREQRLRHSIQFAELGQRFEVVEEIIENEIADVGHEKPYFYYRYERGKAILNHKGLQRSLRREDVDPRQSIIAQRKDRDEYPEITRLGEQYAEIGIYRDWTFGRFTAPRQPQKTDERNDYLLPDFRNLALIINRMKRDSKTKKNLLEYLQRLIDGVDGVEVAIEGGTAQLVLGEGNFSIPATRLSDGTLHALCLLAVLLDPQPSPLVCIEEPERGLHPDAVRLVGELLIEASQRMQIIVTTHSDMLLDMMGERERSQDVLVFDRRDSHTKVNRLKSEKLNPLGAHQTLSDQWHSGQFGGNRW